MDITLTVTEAARNFADVVNRAYYRHESTTLLKNGKPVARIVPVATEFRSAKDIAAWLAGTRPRLTVKEAEEFEADLLTARDTLPPPASKWD
jgi:prevent-host-death family protein